MSKGESMREYTMKRRVENPILNGLISVLIALVVASVGWVIWSQFFQFIFSTIAGDVLGGIEESLRNNYLLYAVEGAYFWIVISTWVWFSLDLGNYGKYSKTTKQPIAGLRYTGFAFLTGIVAFFIFTGILGLWLEPFSWSILFTPQNEMEVALAVRGWGAINFFALSVILAQIPIVSLFQKYPFTKYTKDPWAVAFGTLFLSFLLALLNWIAFILPSFLSLSATLTVGGEEVITAISTQPFVAWETALAVCQIFIFLFLLPAEGGELYPQKVITTKQPWSGIVGFVVAVVGTVLLLPLLRGILGGVANSVGIPVDLAVASFVLTIINVLLTWHHLFYDFPTDKEAPNLLARLASRLAIVLTVGSVLGIIWLNFVHIFPFGGNNLGLGHPMLGYMGGQFVYMMPMLFLNTFFDKWPTNKSVEKE